MTPEDLASFAATALDGATRAWSVTEFAALLDSPHSVLTSPPGAFALGRVIADEAELLLIATVPAHRRNGIGRACLAAFESACTARGASRVFLEVSAANVPARALYASAGYGLLGERPDYYRSASGQMENALVLQKALYPGDIA